MSTIIFLLVLLQLLFSNILGLPFYHQDDYAITVERLDVDWYNHSYATNLTYYYGWYNRTRRALNGSMYLLHDLGSQVTGTLQVYKLMSNEYRYFPITLGANLCEEYKRNNFRAKDLLKNISNVHDCPLQKGFYYIRSNGVYPDFSKFPPYIPRGSYKGHGKLFYKNVLIAEGSAYVTIKDKPMVWD